MPPRLLVVLELRILMQFQDLGGRCPRCVPRNKSQTSEREEWSRYTTRKDKNPDPQTNIAAVQPLSHHLPPLSRLRAKPLTSLPPLQLELDMLSVLTNDIEMKFSGEGLPSGRKDKALLEESSCPLSLGPFVLSPFFTSAAQPWSWSRAAMLGITRQLTASLHSATSLRLEIQDSLIYMPGHRQASWLRAMVLHQGHFCPPRGHLACIDTILLVITRGMLLSSSG